MKSGMPCTLKCHEVRNAMHSEMPSTQGCHALQPAMHAGMPCTWTCHARKKSAWLQHTKQAFAHCLPPTPFGDAAPPHTHTHAHTHTHHHHPHRRAHRHAAVPTGKPHLQHLGCQTPLTPTPTPPLAPPPPPQACTSTRGLCQRLEHTCSISAAKRVASSGMAQPSRAAERSRMTASAAGSAATGASRSAPVPTPWEASPLRLPPPSLLLLGP
eukprot:150323-Chlamydomonas_euryale.AAC.3